MFKLRDYQLKLIADIYEKLKGKNKVCAVLSCGGGKSVVAGKIAKDFTNDNKSVLFLVHRKELCEQIKETFIAMGVDMTKCNVGMVQTINRRIDKLIRYDLIIIDECHHASSKTYKNILKYFLDALVIGFTATPTRLGNNNLGEVFTSLVTSVTTKWLIENHFLSPCRIFSAPLNDFENIKIVNGDYDKKEISEILEKNQVYGQTVENYKKFANNKKTIIYCNSVKSAEETAKEFDKNGFSAEAISGKTKKDDRFRIMKDFRNNKINILCNCDLFGEGLDLPDVECVILLRKTKSLTLYVQQSMRAMRYKPNKSAIIIDHVRNVFEHGLPEENREWKLSSSKNKEETTFFVKRCPECFFVVSSASAKCPGCDYKFTPEDKSREQKIYEAELIEIKEEYLKQKKIEKLKNASYNSYLDFVNWDELEEFRKARRYNFNWSIYKALELDIKVPPKYNGYLHRLGILA